MFYWKVRVKTLIKVKLYVL